ncbi:MAG: hypothetical protein QXH91_08685 [Candidatus Bathyarchaeia archaeon]
MTERVSEILKKLKEMAEELDKITKELNEPELRKRVVEELKKKEYEISLEPLMPYGRPDIIAVKEKEGLTAQRLVIEVKGTDDTLADKLRRYEIGELAQAINGKIILVLPVVDGEDFEIWGLKQIEEID